MNICLANEKEVQETSQNFKWEKSPYLAFIRKFQKECGGQFRGNEVKNRLNLENDRNI